MHILKRSKRRHGNQAISPYQYAGIKVYTDDGCETLNWLEAIGYPALICFPSQPNNSRPLSVTVCSSRVFTEGEG